MAETDRYRVEILVLTHLNHQQDPREAPWIEDYSALLDYLTPPPPPEEPEPGTIAALIAEHTAPVLEELPPPPEGFVQQEELPDPDAVIHIEEMSDVMADAWRRLRLSAPFRPEQYLAWEQGSNEPFPVLRVHDLEVVRIDDPWADLREAAEAALEEEQDILVGEDEEGTVVFTDAASAGTTYIIEQNPQIPDPIPHYRLDGSVELRRSRFLHLDIDLQLREAVFEPETLAALPPPEPPASGSDEVTSPPPLPPPDSYLVHSLRQSRQVKTDRMEYFDGPVLGLLAYVTLIEAEDEESP